MPVNQLIKDLGKIRKIRGQLTGYLVDIDGIEAEIVSSLASETETAIVGEAVGVGETPVADIKALIRRYRT